MSQALALVDSAVALTSELVKLDLAFIESVEYEFVGGGTAVNNL